MRLAQHFHGRGICFWSTVPSSSDLFCPLHRSHGGMLLNRWLGRGHAHGKHGAHGPARGGRPGSGQRADAHPGRAGGAAAVIAAWARLARQRQPLRQRGRAPAAILPPQSRHALRCDANLSLCRVLQFFSPLPVSLEHLFTVPGQARERNCMPLDGVIPRTAAIQGTKD